MCQGEKASSNRQHPAVHQHGLPPEPTKKQRAQSSTWANMPVPSEMMVSRSLPAISSITCETSHHLFSASDIDLDHIASPATARKTCMRSSSPTANTGCGTCLPRNRTSTAEEKPRAGAERCPCLPHLPFNPTEIAHANAPSSGRHRPP